MNASSIILKINTMAPHWLIQPNKKHNAKQLLDTNHFKHTHVIDKEDCTFALCKSISKSTSCCLHVNFMALGLYKLSQLTRFWSLQHIKKGRNFLEAIVVDSSTISIMSTKWSSLHQIVIGVGQILNWYHFFFQFSLLKSLYQGFHILGYQ